MGVTVSNLVQGPGTLYFAVFGTTEPAETLVALNAAPSGSWTDVGGTSDGCNLNVNQEFSELTVDQVVDVPGRRCTKRDVSVSTNMAEIHLENMQAALNGGTLSTVDSAQVKKYEPDASTSATQPAYRALLIDAFAPAQKKRRIIVRRVLNTSGVEFAYKKDSQTVMTATWNAHYVSPSIRPFVVLDDNT